MNPKLASLKIGLNFNGVALATGTAFLVQSRVGPLLVTNRHNVTGRNQHDGQPLNRETGGVPNNISVRFPGVLPGQFVLRQEPLYEGGNDPNVDIPRWREHPVLGATADVVIVPIDIPVMADRHSYVVEGELPISVDVAEPVSVIGYPNGLIGPGSQAIWATGFMASDINQDFNELPVFLVDCRTRRGQSGSPVIAYRSGGMAIREGGGLAGYGNRPIWRFLGIYSGRLGDDTDIGYVWKASAVAAIVSRVEGERGI